MTAPADVRQQCAELLRHPPPAWLRDCSHTEAAAFRFWMKQASRAAAGELSASSGEQALRALAPLFDGQRPVVANPAPAASAPPLCRDL